MSRVIASFLVAFGLAIALLASERFVMAQAGPYGTLMGVAGGGVAAGGTVTGGQLVVNFDPVGTATNQASLFINMPSGAAATDKALAIKTNDTTDRFSVDNSGATVVGGTLDLHGNVSTSTSPTCWTGVTGVPCFSETIAVNANDGLYIHSQSTAGTAVVRTYNSTNSQVGAMGYYDTASTTAFQGKHVMFTTLGTGFVISTNTDYAAGTAVLEINDGSAGANNLFKFLGSGAVKWNPNTSAAGITCNSANEGTEYVRVIAASNKSGKCLCTQTSSGVYAWTVSYTGGGTALVAGDC